MAIGALYMSDLPGGQSRERRPAPDSGPILPSMQGFSKDVVVRIREIGGPRGAYRDVLDHIMLMSFGNAGYQRKHGAKNPGMWCYFELREWSKLLTKGNKGNLRRALQWLEDHHIISIIEEPGSGQGRILWNENLKEWTGPGWGGARPGAGAPRGNMNAHKEAPSDPTSEQPTILTLIDSKTDPETIKLSTPASLESIKLSTVASLETIKLSTPASSEAGNDAASASRVRSNPEEEITIPTGIAADASGAPAPGSESQASSRSRKRAPSKQTEAEKQRQKYARELCTLLRQRLRLKELPNENQDHQGALWFYTAGPDGMPAEPEQVMRCYFALKKPGTFWGGRYLNLQSLHGPWVEWLRDPRNVVAGIQAEQSKAETRERLNGSGAAAGTPAPGAPRRVATVRPGSDPYA
jgi:hypothetical protein